MEFQSTTDTYDIIPDTSIDIILWQIKNKRNMLGFQNKVELIINCSYIYDITDIDEELEFVLSNLLYVNRDKKKTTIKIRHSFK